MDTDEEGYSSYSDMEPDPGTGYLGGSVKANGHSRYPLRNGRSGAHNGKNGAKGAVSAAAAAAAALPDIGAVLKSISQVGRFHHAAPVECVTVTTSNSFPTLSCKPD
jgi:hypothetical protein